MSYDLYEGVPSMKLVRLGIIIAVLVSASSAYGVDPSLLYR